MPVTASLRKNCHPCVSEVHGVIWVIWVIWHQITLNKRTQRNGFIQGTTVLVFQKDVWVLYLRKRVMVRKGQKRVPEFHPRCQISSAIFSTTRSTIQDNILTAGSFHSSPWMSCVTWNVWHMAMSNGPTRTNITFNIRGTASTAQLQ